MAEQGALVAVLAGMFAQDEARRELPRGLCIAWRKGVSLALSRRGVWPSAAEIAVVRVSALRCGVVLDGAPVREQVTNAGGKWCVARWSLEVSKL
ncbi:MAG: hypothetical protein WCK89_23635 [bacterium]